MTSQPPPAPMNDPPPDRVIPYAQPAVALPFRDRRTGLLVCGILLIVIGAMAGCTTLAMPFALVAVAMVPGANPGGAATVLSVIGATIVYAAATAGLIWLGIGSIKAHRYVRPFVLTLAWLTIAMSVAAAIGSIGSLSVTRAIAQSGMTARPTVRPVPNVVPATAPGTGSAVDRGGGAANRPAPGNVGGVPVVDFSDTDPQAPDGTTGVETPTLTVGAPPPAPPPPGAVVGMTIGVVIAGLFYLVVGVGAASAFIWFFRSDHTRQTLEFFDPRPRWTDGRPVPVLGVVIVLGMIVAAMPLMLLQQAAMLSSARSTMGMSAAVGLQVLTAIIAAAALRPAYRMQPLGWSLAVLVLLLSTAGAITMIVTGDPVAQMRQWGVIEAEALRGVLRDQQTWQIALGGLFAVAALGYLIWVRRFFSGEPVPR